MCDRLSHRLRAVWAYVSLSGVFGSGRRRSSRRLRGTGTLRATPGSFRQRAIGNHNVGLARSDTPPMIAHHFPCISRPFSVEFPSVRSCRRRRGRPGLELPGLGLRRPVRLGGCLGVAFGPRGHHFRTSEGFSEDFPSVVRARDSSYAEGGRPRPTARRRSRTRRRGDERTSFPFFWHGELSSQIVTS